MGPLNCVPNRTHRFDSESGWCAHGCGVRDDQHVVNRAGTVVRVGHVSPADDLRRRIDPKGDD